MNIIVLLLEVDVQAATSVIENNMDKRPNMSKDELIKIGFEANKKLKMLKLMEIIQMLQLLEKMKLLNYWELKKLMNISK